MTKKPKQSGSVRTQFQKGNTLGHGSKLAAAALPVMTDPDGEYTPAQLAQVTKLASLDRSNATIATSLGMTTKDFSAALRLNAALANAMECGTGLARDFYVDRLRAQGKRMFVPNIYCAKSLHGLSDAAADTDNSGRRIQIVLPGALPAETVVEGECILDAENVDGLSITAATQFPVPQPRSDPEFGERIPASTRSPNVRSARAARDFEAAVGIDTRRSSFTDAEWKRFNKDR